MNIKKFNLQMFAEAVQGKQIVYLYRVLSTAATKAAFQIGFVTENSLTKSKDSESTVTKDGTIRTPGAMEVETSSTSIYKKGDTIIDELDEAFEKDELIEVWRVNLADPVSAEEGNTKFHGKYYQGYLTEFEETASSEEAVEHSLTFALNGSGVKGEITVTVEQQQAAYAFADTTPTTGA